MLKYLERNNRRIDRKNMRILYIDHYAGSLSMGMEFRPYYFSKEWEKQGHSVRIIGADYSHIRIQQPEVYKDFTIEKIDDIAYQWIKTLRYSGNGVKRAVSMFQFVGKLWMTAGKIAKEFHPDVVITSSTYPLDSYAGYRIAKQAKAKYIHEAHDVWPLTLVEMGGMSAHHPFVKVLGIAEKYAYKHAEKVISVLPATRDHMMECGLSNPEKFVYIPNGIVSKDWETPDSLDAEQQRVFDKLHREGKFIVGYLGGHALTNALHTFIDAAERRKDDKSIVFVLVGKGVEKQKLIDRVAEKQLTNVVFLPPVPKKQVPSALHNMDALYIGAADNSLYRFGISMNKLYDYMMAEKPIIYGIKAANNEVEEARCGLSIEPESPESLVQAIMNLQEMKPEERAQLGENGKLWVLENRRYEILAVDFLEKIGN